MTRIPRGPVARFEPEHGPVDLSGVDLDAPRFRQAFPEGRVPVRQMPYQDWFHGDLVAWASVVLARHDALCDMPVEAIERHAAKLRLAARSDARFRTPTHRLQELRRQTAQLVNLGLSLRAIARYTGFPLELVVGWWMTGANAFEERQAERIADAQDLLAAGDLSQSEIARRCGISRKTVMRLAKAQA